MKRKTKVLLCSLVGAGIGALANWALLATMNTALVALAFPAFFVGSSLAHVFYAGGDDGMGIIVLTVLVYFVALGAILGCFISLGITKKEI